MLLKMLPGEYGRLKQDNNAAIGSSENNCEEAPSTEIGNWLDSGLKEEGGILDDGHISDLCNQVEVLLFSEMEQESPLIHFGKIWIPCVFLALLV